MGPSDAVAAQSGAPMWVTIMFMHPSLEAPMILSAELQLKLAGVVFTGSTHSQAIGARTQAAPEFFMWA
jgi:hypothetical protein